MSEKLIKYEQAVENLEEIIKELEKGDTTLDNSLHLFTQGIKLVKICNHHLNQAEEKIQVLINQNELEDFQLPEED